MDEMHLAGSDTPAEPNRVLVVAASDDHRDLLTRLVRGAGGKLQGKINDNIEAGWAEWTKKKTCHVAGMLSFAEIERLSMVQLVTAGEAIIRKVRRADLPYGLALQLLEPDRLADSLNPSVHRLIAHPAP